MNVVGEELKKLISKYSTQGPRYTSYPTAVEFSPAVNPKSWAEFLAGDRTLSREPCSLYVHIPFCKSLCYFCACHKIIVKDRSIVRPYLEAVKKELTCYANHISVINQMHWGGGSPSYLTPDETTELFKHVEQHFRIKHDDSDISIELDPRTTDKNKINTYKELGFNRLSLGVQDFSPAVQTAVNREQSYELTAQMIMFARELGFNSINVDLIYGLPEQKLESFGETLEKVIDLAPDRIALYGYAHVTWIKKVQNSFSRFDLPNPEERIELFLLAVERLQQAGYLHIGMDHFSTPKDSLAKALKNGSLKRNFMGYTTGKGEKLFAVGASAISCFPQVISQNYKELNNYIEQADGRQFPVERGIFRSIDDQMRADIIDALFCRIEVDIVEIEERWQISFWNTFGELIPKLESFQNDGLLTIEKKSIRISPIGRLFVRNVAMLFDAYLEKHQQANRQVFSATV